MPDLSSDWRVIFLSVLQYSRKAGACVQALAELVFDRLELDVVTLGYDEGNDRSKAVIERFVDRVGGQYDGVRRNTTRRDDELVDAYNYSVTAEQYQTAGMADIHQYGTGDVHEIASSDE